MNTKLQAMPCGKWRGVAFANIPLASVRALREWWASDAPRDDASRQAIVDALTGELIRRQRPAGKKSGRRRGKVPPADGRRRSMVIVKTRPGR